MTPQRGESDGQRAPWSSWGLLMPWVAAAPWGREAPQPPTPSGSPAIPHTVAAIAFARVYLLTLISPIKTWVQRQVHPAQPPPPLRAHAMTTASPFVPLCLFFLSTITTYTCVPSLLPTPGPACTSQHFHPLQQYLLTRDMAVPVPPTAPCTPGEQKWQGSATDLRWRSAGKSRNVHAEQLHPSE